MPYHVAISLFPFPGYKVCYFVYKPLRLFGHASRCEKYSRGEGGLLHIQHSLQVLILLFLLVLFVYFLKSCVLLDKQLRYETLMSSKVLSNGVQTLLADTPSRAWSPVIVLGLRQSPSFTFYSWSSTFTS